jgi:hypothetical protein
LHLSAEGLRVDNAVVTAHLVGHPGTQWAKEAHLAQVRSALAREIERRPDGDFSLTERYHDLSAMEDQLMADLACPA